MTTGPAIRPPNPFPGLRPFSQGEERLFFGRETQVDALVDTLAATRFLTVVGTSGSGKSSLVNCGLLPALHRGLLASAGSAWHVATLRPGNRPIRALAEALARPGVLAPQEIDESGFTAGELMESTLRMGKLGLVDAFEQAHLDRRQNLLVVVDQFEELFRYQALATTARADHSTRAIEDATAFVNLLLEVRAHPELPIYVVLTMRSDFLGECAQFFGLPEAINRGQYLVPRMTREERRSAIAGPTAVGGAELDPVLLTRLVNDVGDNPDQLSILQHALNRTWDQWQKTGGQGPLTLSHYDAVGTMAHALNQHADEAFNQLADGRQRVVAKALFQAITDKTADARGTRRPTRMDTLCEITGATAAELTSVIDVFRDPSRSFLMPPAGTPLTPDAPIDISHESLMRVWDQLRMWADEETQSAQIYRRLAETAELHRSGHAGLLRPPDLQFATKWRERQQPRAAWAQRYRAGFEDALGFLQESERVFDEETRAEAARLQRQLRARRIKLFALPVILFLLGVPAAMFYLYQQATEERRDADLARKNAEKEQQAAAEERRLSEELAAATRRAQAERDETARQYDAATRSEPALRARVEKALVDQSLVYLHFGDPSQQATTERLRASLAKASYSAPGIELVRVVPSRSELRYFRETDAAAANGLVKLLEQWNWGALQLQLVKGYESESRLRQFELWQARPDVAEVGRLLQQISAETADERRAAGQRLQDKYTASTLAITEALKLLAAGRVSPPSPSGRFNALYFLTRTAPLAWDSALEAAGRETLARLRVGAGKDVAAELQRLARLLDAVKAGEAAPPAADRD
jgi:hypothetical protein